MVYNSMEEMEEVVGKLEDNSFINQQTQEFADFKNRVKLSDRKWPYKHTKR